MIRSTVLKNLCMAIAVAIFIALIGVGKEQAAVGNLPPVQLTPSFSRFYSLVDLGSVRELPPAYAGLTFNPKDPNILLIGGRAGLPKSAIYSVKVTRTQNKHITGFGRASLVAQSPGINEGGIDAGLTYSPREDVLFYTTYADNSLGQIKAGSTRSDKQIDLKSLGIASSTGALAFVPQGFAGAGRLKITSYTTNLFYDTTITPDGSGTYKIANPAKSVQLRNGIDSFVYIKAGNRGFSKDSLLMTEYDSNKVSVYTIDANGDPIATTRKDFITGISTHLPTTSSTLGATVDPLTGDVLFSTYFEEAPSKSKILAVKGFRLLTGDDDGDDDDDDDGCENLPTKFCTLINSKSQNLYF